MMGDDPNGNVGHFGLSGEWSLASLQSSPSAPAIMNSESSILLTPQSRSSSPRREPPSPSTTQISPSTPSSGLPHHQGLSTPVVQQQRRPRDHVVQMGKLTFDGLLQDLQSVHENYCDKSEEAALLREENARLHNQVCVTGNVCCASLACVRLCPGAFLQLCEQCENRQLGIAEGGDVLAASGIGHLCTCGVFSAFFPSRHVCSEIVAVRTKGLYESYCAASFSIARLGRAQGRQTSLGVSLHRSLASSLCDLLIHPSSRPLCLSRPHVHSC